MACFYQKLEVTSIFQQYHCKTQSHEHLTCSHLTRGQLSNLNHNSPLFQVGCNSKLLLKLRTHTHTQHFSFVAFPSIIFFLHPQLISLHHSSSILFIFLFNITPPACMSLYSIIISLCSKHFLPPHSLY